MKRFTKVVRLRGTRVVKAITAAIRGGTKVATTTTTVAARIRAVATTTRVATTVPPTVEVVVNHMAASTAPKVTRSGENPMARPRVVANPRAVARTRVMAREKDPKAGPATFQR